MRHLLDLRWISLVSMVILVVFSSDRQLEYVSPSGTLVSMDGGWARVAQVNMESGSGWRSGLYWRSKVHRRGWGDLSCPVAIPLAVLFVATMLTTRSLDGRRRWTVLVLATVCLATFTVATTSIARMSVLIANDGWCSCRQCASLLSERIDDTSLLILRVGKLRAMEPACITIAVAIAFAWIVTRSLQSIAAHVAMQRQDLSNCTTCGYDLSGCPDTRCPECGTVSDDSIDLVDGDGHSGS